MVKIRFKDITKNDAGKGLWEQSFRPGKVTAYTVYGTCKKRHMRSTIPGIAKHLSILYSPFT